MISETEVQNLISNCTNHPIALYDKEALYKNRQGRVEVKPDAKPPIILQQKFPLNVNSYGVSEAIDENGVYGDYLDSAPIVPPVSEWKPIMVVSIKYLEAVLAKTLRNMGSPHSPLDEIPCLFLDRLWLAEPVYAPNTIGKPQKIGCYLEKAMPALRVDTYINFIRNAPAVPPSVIAVKAALNQYKDYPSTDSLAPYGKELQEWLNKKTNMVTFEA